MPQSTSTVGQKPQVGGEFLTFFLDDDEYGFEILKVQEIIGMMSVTPVPWTPPFVQSCTCSLRIIDQGFSQAISVV
jgi:chemotaxis signal transduction protein